MVIIGAATLGVLTFGFAEEVSEPAPAADVDVSVDAEQLRFLHGGGASLSPEKLRVVVKSRSGKTTRQAFTQASSETFAAGSELSLTSPYATTDMTVTLVHEPSGSVLLRDSVTVSATKSELAGPIGRLGFTNEPAIDQDGDGDFEDIDGDGDTDIFDTYSLYFAYLNIEQNGAYDDGSGAATLYDFNDDGTFDGRDILSHYYFEAFP
jgi:FlaG/FlaF family flagellin (archaellin)